jgi:hypothetical protein
MHQKSYIRIQGGNSPGPNCARNWVGHIGGGWFKSCHRTMLWYRTGTMNSWTNNNHVKWMRGMFRESDNQEIPFEVQTEEVLPPLSLGGDTFKKRKYYVPPQTAGGTVSRVTAMTCRELQLEDPSMASGTYTLRHPTNPRKTWNTYCMMDKDNDCFHGGDCVNGHGSQDRRYTDGGGWTLLARSINQQNNNNMNQQDQDMWRGTGNGYAGSWLSYTQDGFGSPASGNQFWAPLSLWAALLKKYPQNIVAFTDSAYVNPKTNAPRMYDMSLDEKDDYRIRCRKRENSDVFNTVAIQHPMRFTTWDRDNDT